MKSRYLFPLIYVVVNACWMLFLNVPLITFFIALPSMLTTFVEGVVLKTIRVPIDPTPTYFVYIVGVGTILQMYLLGLLWELLVAAVQKLVRRKRLAA